MVLSTLQVNLKSGDINLTQKAAPQLEYEAEVIEKQITREKLKLIRVQEAYENGIDTIDEYKTNKQKITNRIDQLEASRPEKEIPKKEALVKQFRIQHKNVLEQLKDPDISSEEKNQLLRSFVDKIVFDKAKNQIEIFYYL